MKCPWWVVLLLALAGMSSWAAPETRIEKPFGGWLPAGDGPVEVEVLAAVREAESAWLLVNEDPPRRIQIVEGQIRARHLLSIGSNRIVVRVEGEGGAVAQDQVVIQVSGQSDELRVAIGWDDPEVDLDLEIGTPAGQWVTYALPRSVGVLLADRVAGGGGEVYLCRSPPPGSYRIRVRARSGERVVSCRVRITVSEGRFDPPIPGGTFLVGGLHPVVDVGKVFLR